MAKTQKGPEHTPQPKLTWRGMLPLALVSAVLYLVNLGANGWANAYYSAAVQAGSQDWHAFLFGSLDVHNSITVDKPPFSLWFMILSVKLFGLNIWAICLPQVLMGVASVLLLTYLIKRQFGVTAGYGAGITLLLTPVAALMFRFNNPDALLTLLMLLIMWATLNFLTTTRFRWAAWAGLFVGLAFFTKTLQALLILPAVGVVVLLLTHTSWLKRLTGLAIALTTAVIVGGSWLFAVALVPATVRPYIGSTMHNSVWELVLGYNGVERIVGTTTMGENFTHSGLQPTGFTRLLTGTTGAGVGWFIPLALITLVLAVVVLHRTRRLDDRYAAVWLWGGSALVMVTVFSFMSGIFHAYYTVQLAPFIAAMVGVYIYLWQNHAHGRYRYVLIGALLVSGAYEGTLPYFNRGTGTAISIPTYALTILAVLLLLGRERIDAGYHKLITFVVVAALIAAPMTYLLPTVFESKTGSDPTAGPILNSPGLGSTLAKPTTGHTAKNTAFEQLMTSFANAIDYPRVLPATVVALQADADRYEWAGAAIGGQNAAGYQLYSGKPILNLGGFKGADPAPTLSAFKKLVAAKRIHYFIFSSTGKFPDTQSYQIAKWVYTNFEGKPYGAVRLYDLSKS